MTRDFNKVFNLSLKRNEKEIKQCLKMSKDIDAVVVSSIVDGLSAKLTAGILADALGRFLGKFKGKEKLWEVLESQIKKRANL